MARVIYITGSCDMFPYDSPIERGSMKQLGEWLYGSKVFACDTETTGMMNFENRVIMLQIGDEHTQFVVDTRSVDVSELRHYFEDKSRLKIFHNAKFDINFLRFTFGWRVENVYDTFLAECCITNGLKDRSLGLAGLTVKYCSGAALDKSKRGQFVEMGSKPFTSSQIIYGARDVSYLMEIMDKQLFILEQSDLLDVLNLENKVVLALSDIEYNGMLLDSERWVTLAEKANSRLFQYQLDLDRMVLEEPRLKSYKKSVIQSSMFEEIIPRKVDVKWSSPLQVLELFKKLGLEVESSSEKEVSKYQNKEPLIRKFIDYKKEQKLSTTYGLDFLKYINPSTGRIHTSFWQVLETHRISSSEPNIQQIPSMGEKWEDGYIHYPYLECFVAPEGFSIVGADFSGQELRLIAEGSQDPLWIQAFNNGEDLHSKIASIVFGIPINEVKSKPEFVLVGFTKVYLRGKSPRDVAKTLNFALAYGASEYKIADTLGITVPEAKAIIDMYFVVIPKVRQFLEKCAKYGVKNSHMRSFSPYSIKRNFVYDRTDRKAVGEVERASKNTIIQATGAIMVKLAMVSLREKIRELPYEVRMFLQVHDAIYCYVENQYAEEWGNIQKEIMEDCGRLFIKTIPVISDLSISKMWKK